MKHRKEANEKINRLLKMGNKKMKISVIMPVYNAEKYLSAALDSIINQTYRNIEIIAINDGSTDKSGEILDGYAKADTRMIVKHIYNQGVSHARNLGLQIATGEFVYFMDADDVLELNAFNNLICYTCYDMIVFGALFEYTKEGRTESNYACLAQLNNKKDIGDYLIKLDLKYKNIFLNYLWNRLFKLSIIKNNALSFDETVELGEDFLFNTYYLIHCDSSIVLPDCYYHYFIRNNGSLVSKFCHDEFIRRTKMRQAFVALSKEFYVTKALQPLIKENEGANCITSIEKVVKANCTLSRRQDKVAYISQFLNGEPCNDMLYYINRHPSKKNYVIKIGVKIGNPNVLYFLLQILEYYRNSGKKTRLYVEKILSR